MGKIKYVLLIGMLIIGVLCNGCSFSSKEDGKPHNGYYQYVAMSPDGKFTCRGKLDDATAKKGGPYYKVEMDEKDKNKVKTITAVQNDKPIDVQLCSTLHEKRGTFASIDISEDNGYLKYTFRNKNRDIGGGVYSESPVIRFKMGDKECRDCAYLYDHEGNLQAQMIFSYDKKGNLTKVGFADNKGKRYNLPKTEAYEVQLSYDEKNDNRLVRIEYLNESGQPITESEPDDYSTKELSYDDKGRIIEVKFFKKDGQLVEGRVSNSVLEKVDQISEMIRCPKNTIENIQSSLLRIRAGLVDEGAVTKYTYNNDSFYPSEISFHGQDGQNIGGNILGGVVSSIKLSYDDKNNLIDWVGYGVDGTSMNRKNDKVSGWSFSYDDEGRIIEISTHDGDGKLVALSEKNNNGEQIAKRTIAYDDEGRISKYSFFDINNKPCYYNLFGLYKAYQLEYLYDTDSHKGTSLFYNGAYKIYDADGNEKTVNPEALLYGTWKYEGDTLGKVTFTFNENHTISCSVPGVKPAYYTVSGGFGISPDGHAGKIYLKKSGFPEIDSDKLFIEVSSPDKIYIHEFGSRNLIRTK